MPIEILEFPLCIKNKILRIKSAFVDGIVEEIELKDELDFIKNQKKITEEKIKDLTIKESTEDHKNEMRLIYNLKQLDQIKNHIMLERIIYGINYLRNKNKN